MSLFVSPTVSVCLSSSLLPCLCVSAPLCFCLSFSLFHSVFFLPHQVTFKTKKSETFLYRSLCLSAFVSFFLSPPVSFCVCVSPVNWANVKKSERVDCQHSEKRSQTHKRLKERLFYWTKQAKTCSFSRKSSFSSYVQHKNKLLIQLISCQLDVGGWRKEKGTRQLKSVLLISCVFLDLTKCQIFLSLCFSLPLPVSLCVSLSLFSVSLSLCRSSMSLPLFLTPLPL